MGAGGDTKSPMWQHHCHQAELAMPPQQPSLSPVPLCQGCPLRVNSMQPCRVMGAPWGHICTPRWGTRGAGMRWDTSCSGASPGSCYRRKRRNDIPVAERPSSLGRAWEMGLRGKSSPRCEGPWGQLWGEDLGGSHIALGAAAAPRPPCPAPSPAPHRHPGVRGRSTSPALRLKIENLKTSDFHSAKNSHWRLGAGAQGTLAPPNPPSPRRGGHNSAVVSGGVKGTGVLAAVRTPGPSTVPHWPCAQRVMA